MRWSDRLLIREQAEQLQRVAAACVDDAVRGRHADAADGSLGELAHRVTQHLSGDAPGLGAAEQREIDVGVPGRAEPVEDGVGEQRRELVRPGAHAEPRRRGVDVVEVAGVDRADEGQRGVGERVEMRGGRVGGGRPTGFVSRGQRHDAQAGTLAASGAT